MTSIANWLTAVGTTGATLVALYGALVLPRREGWRRRRNYSKLGVAIAKSLLEEVKTGRQIMCNMLAWGKGEVAAEPDWPNLPAASWEGMSTIPDEVLLRIIALLDDKTEEGSTNSTQGLLSGDGDFADRAYSPLDIRVHCKNYFAHIVVTINSNFVIKSPVSMIKSRKASVAKWFEESGQGGQDFLRATDKAIAMLDETIKLLTKNAKQQRPM